MNIEELRKKLKELKIKNQTWIKNLSKKESDILYNETIFLDNTYSWTLRRIYFINNLTEKRYCPVCGKEIKTIWSDKQTLKVFCSNDCKTSTKGLEIIAKKTVTTSIAKYGSDYYVKKGELNNLKTEQEKEAINDKRKQTNIDNLGVDNPFKSKKIIEQVKQDNIKKYNVEYYNQTEQSKEQHIETCLKTYGVDNVSKIEEIKNKIIQTKRENNWEIFCEKLFLKHVVPMFDDNIYMILKNNDIVQFKCLKCDNIFSFKITSDQGLEIKDITCDKHKYKSKYEYDIQQWLETDLKLINIQTNKQFGVKNNPNRTSYELDLYLPDYNIGIEFHGLYWHSELHKDDIYHQEKYLFFKEKGIELIQIFENEWLQKEQIVKSIIKNKLKKSSIIIPARKCIIKEINNDEYKQFVELNHIQGYSTASIRLGLFYNDELVSLISLAKPRYNKKYEYELIRSCNKMDTVVIGGFDRLFKHFVKNNNPKSIITYSDVRYFNGSGYVKSGFVQKELSKPDYFYFLQKDKILHHRSKFQKHKLEKLLETFDPNKTEYENMLDNKYLRIFDAGNLVFEWLSA